MDEDGSAPDDARLFAGFEPLAAASGLLLAVSGGPDSMALLHLAAGWAAGRDASPVLHVATVDHGWRPDAAVEAALVGAAAARLGLPHEILTWSGIKPSTRRQERAREARYALLCNHAAAVGATHVVTAHHADDQAETILFRLGRGSGLSGLAGMRALAPLGSGVTLARPLLAAAKADLVAFCRAHAIAYAEDPSNRDPAFARTRLRAAAPALAALGLDAVTLSRLGRRMRRADAALDAATDRIERALAPTGEAGVYRVALRDDAAREPEILLRLLQRAVAHVAPASRPRLERLEALGEALLAAAACARAHRTTLGGTRVVLGADAILEVTAAPPRRHGPSRD